MKLSEIKELVNQVAKAEIDRERSRSMLLESPQWKFADCREAIIEEAPTQLQPERSEKSEESERAEVGEIQTLVEQALKEMLNKDG
tara:strand:- start:939 stop:1196 length:258 start_codon:yes stop_codon:yes gene_type:complete